MVILEMLWSVAREASVCQTASVPIIGPVSTSLAKILAPVESAVLTLVAPQEGTSRFVLATTATGEMLCSRVIRLVGDLLLTAGLRDIKIFKLIRFSL